MSSSKDSMNPSSSDSKKLFMTSNHWFMYTPVVLFITFSIGLAVYLIFTTSYYNVYVKGELIGSISSHEELQNLFDEKIRQNEKEYPEIEVKLNTDDISIEEMRASDPDINSEETLQKLGNYIKVYTEGAELKVGDEVVAIVKDEKTANRILQEVKHSYTPEAVQANNSDAASKIKSVAAITSAAEKENEQEEQVTLASLRLKEEVVIDEVKVAPQRVLTDEEAIKILTEGKEEEFRYQVKEGDTLSSIASSYQTTVEEIHSLNPELTDHVIRLGQQLTLYAPKPAITVTTVENVTQEVITEPQIEVRKSDELKSGVTKVIREGQTGRKQVNYRVTKENGQVVKEEWLGQEVIEASVSQIVLQGTKVTGEGSGVFSWPVNGAVVSSSFGQRWGRQHKGIDLVGERAIQASDEGVVTFSGQKSGYGNVIIINHRNGYETVYAHLDSMSVKVGQIVEKGQNIGVMGNTGRSTGTHLHFEIKKDSVARNPMKYLQ